MRKIYSFKCPLILKPNIGWRHEFNRRGWFGIVLILSILASGLVSTIAIAAVLLLYVIVRNLWQDADHLFVFKKDDTNEKIKVFIYQFETKKLKYWLRVKNGKYEESLVVDEYEWIKLNNGKGVFIYSLDGVWFNLTDNKQLLGKRAGKIMFVEEIEIQSSVNCVVKIFNSSAELVYYYAQKAFYGKDKLRVPEFEDLDFDDRDYVLIKSDKQYKLISSSYQDFSDRGMSFVSTERFKSAIFVEDGKTVILVWDEKTSMMKSIYRKENAVDSLTLFVEPGSRKNVVMRNASLYEFNAKIKGLRVLYQGQIVSIDNALRTVYVDRGLSFSY